LSIVTPLIKGIFYNAVGKKRGCYVKTRTKTSIRYAKENDREKRERRKERERKVKGEI
jgi:hypothetical protein